MRKVPLPDAVQNATASYMTAHPPVEVTLAGNVRDGKPATVALPSASAENTAH